MPKPEVTFFVGREAAAEVAKAYQDYVVREQVGPEERIQVSFKTVPVPKDE